MHPEPQKGIRAVQIATMTLSLLAFCAGMATAVMHYLNGFILSASNALTNCLTVPETVIKYKNVNTLLFVVTAAVVVGVLASLALSITGIIWFTRKNLSRELAAKYKRGLFLSTAIALWGDAVSAAYYALFLIDYSSYSCGASVTSACLPQIVLEGTAVLCLLSCLVLSLLLPKHTETNPAKEPGSKSNAHKKMDHKANEFELSMTPQSIINQLKSPSNMLQERPPENKHGKYFKGSRGGSQSRPLMNDTGSVRNPMKFLEVPGATPKAKEATLASSIRAKQSVRSPTQQQKRPTSTINEINIDAPQLEGRLMPRQLLTPLQRTQSNRAELRNYQPLLPFLAFRPDVKIQMKTFSDSQKPRVDQISSNPRGPKKEPTWEYPDIPFSKLEEASFEKSIVPKLLKQPSRPLNPVPDGAFERRQKRDAQLLEMMINRRRRMAGNSKQQSSMGASSISRSKAEDKGRTLMQAELREKYGFV